MTSQKKKTAYRKSSKKRSSKKSSTKKSTKRTSSKKSSKKKGSKKKTEIVAKTNHKRDDTNYLYFIRKPMKVARRHKKTGKESSIKVSPSKMRGLIQGDKYLYFTSKNPTTGMLEIGRYKPKKSSKKKASTKKKSSKKKKVVKRKTSSKKKASKKKTSEKKTSAAIKVSKVKKILC